MSMQTLTWDVDAAAAAGNSDAYSLALATQARQQQMVKKTKKYTRNSQNNKIHKKLISTKYTVSIQLTNWILWNGKFYYRDVIKMTITRAKGEGNGHFYHIEVIDLPFHTIPFVSCFIPLIENTKKWTFIENLQANVG